MNSATYYGSIRSRRTSTGSSMTEEDHPTPSIGDGLETKKEKKN